ncbi:MAG: hypothetical protein RMI56_05935 [Sulfolobales archaeon]|nr:hypothetical protein [Sulfolobales archaeon]MDW8083316.1 hypothetical protein [Sulfolobales archaeon]
MVITGGGKSKKPLSVMDKEARKKEKETLKKSAREEKTSKKTQAELGLSEQLIKRASKTISESKIATPSSLASALGVKVSVARALLKEIIRSGEAVLVARHRGFLLARSSRSQ